MHCANLNPFVGHFKNMCLVLKLCADPSWLLVIKIFLKSVLHYKRLAKMAFLHLGWPR